MRTFFFVIFGFTIDIFKLDDRSIFLNGMLILLIIYFIRFAYLKIFRKENAIPEGFVSPRGLISILLYYNLPVELKIPEIGTSFLFMAVLGTSVIMTIGLMASKRNAKSL